MRNGTEKCSLNHKNLRVFFYLPTVVFLQMHRNITQNINVIVRDISFKKRTHNNNEFIPHKIKSGPRLKKQYPHLCTITQKKLQ